MKHVGRWVLVAFAGILGCGGDGGAPASPGLSSPAQGETTGSVWSDAALRPRFSWKAAQGASSYELVVDDSCATAIGCDFPSPEVDQVVPVTAFQPAVALPVSTTAPVGRRYFWRVRSCAGTTCGVWSPARYVDVGRQRQDFNGDGFGDLVENDRDGGTVFFGDQTLALLPGWTTALDQAAAEYQIAGTTWAGDLDGDGFGDLAVATFSSVTGAQSIRIFRGGPVPGTTAAVDAGVGADWTEVYSVKAAGDMDGDGFADLAFSTAQGGASVAPVQAWILRGETSLSATNLVSVPLPDDNAATQAAGCDLDGDGASDLLYQGGAGVPYLVSIVPGATPLRVTSMSTAGLAGTAFFDCVGGIAGDGGRALLGQDASKLGFFGISGGAIVVLAQCPSAGASPSGGFSTMARAGDTDGDGTDDFVLGDPSSHRAFLFFGGCSERIQELPGRALPGGGHVLTGDDVGSPGDMNGDGVSEVAVGNLQTGIDSVIGGEIHLYLGGATVGQAAPIVLPTLTADGLSTYRGGLD